LSRNQRDRSCSDKRSAIPVRSFASGGGPAEAVAVLRRKGWWCSARTGRYRGCTDIRPVGLKGSDAGKDSCKLWAKSCRADNEKPRPGGRVRIIVASGQRSLANIRSWSSCELVERRDRKSTAANEKPRPVAARPGRVTQAMSLGMDASATPYYRQRSRPAAVIACLGSVCRLSKNKSPADTREAWRTPEGVGGLGTAASVSRLIRPRLLCSEKNSGAQSIPAIPRRSLRTPLSPGPHRMNKHSSEKMAKSRRIGVN
jgi:hypothetical protein